MTAGPRGVILGGIGSPLDRLLVQVHPPIVAATRPVDPAEPETLVRASPSTAPTIAPKRMSAIRQRLVAAHAVDATLGTLAEDVRIAATLLGWIDRGGLSTAGARLLAARDPDEQSLAFAVALLENPPLSAIASALLLGDWLELRELAPALERTLGLAPAIAHWLAPGVLAWRSELREQGWTPKRVVEHLKARTKWMDGLSVRTRDVLARLGVVERDALLALEWAELRDLQHVRPETIREIERFRGQLRRARDRVPDARPRGGVEPVERPRTSVLAVHTAARRLVGHAGCASIAAVARACAGDDGTAPELGIVRSTLALDPEVRWLDEDIGWFWIPTVARNRLVARIEKILAATDEIELAALRAAIARDRAMARDVPPLPVLAALCDQLDGCTRVDGTCIRSTRPRAATEPVLDGDTTVGELARVAGLTVEQVVAIALGRT